jgi:hypothetical protein
LLITDKQGGITFETWSGYRSPITCGVTISMLAGSSAHDYQNSDYQFRRIFLGLWWEKRYRFGSSATTAARKA